MEGALDTGALGTNLAPAAGDDFFSDSVVVVTGDFLTEEIDLTDLVGPEAVETLAVEGDGPARDEMQTQTGSEEGTNRDEESIIAALLDPIVIIQEPDGGTDGPVQIVGNNEDDQISGGIGNDTIAGGGGDDVLSGLAGNDVLNGGSEDDVLDGGTGNDTVNGEGGNDSADGGADNDVVNGDAGNDFLTGGAGDDFLGGGSGNDTLVGGAGEGDDTLDGGPDNDTATFASATLPITVNLQGGFASGPEIGNDQIVPNTIENVIAGLGSDILVGDVNNNTLQGNDGDDTLTGGGGNDLLFGGKGIDTAVFGGTVAGYVINLGTGTVSDIDPNNGDNGNDNLSGIELIQFADRIVFLDGTNNPPLAIDDLAETGEGLALTIPAEALLINDREFDGNPLTIESVVSGNGGTVALDGNGDALFIPDAGFSGDAQFFYTVSDGQGGTDTASVSVDVTANTPPMAIADPYATDRDNPLVVGAAAGVVANDQDDDGDALLVSAFDAVSAQGGAVAVLENGGFTYTPPAGFFGVDTFGYTVSDGRGGEDNTGLATITVNFAGVSGTAGPDSLDGSAGNDTILGLAGDDTLSGLGGNDTIEGGDDNDILVGGPGDDSLIGGNGLLDRANYFGAAAGAVVDLGAGTADDGDGGTDTLVGIEGVDGSLADDSIVGDGNDNSFFGSDAKDTLEGLGGDDFLSGGDGDDSISGGEGDADALLGGLGNDMLDGGDGTGDEAQYGDASGGIIIDLGAGTADDGDGGVDTLMGIEGVLGSANDDFINGNLNPNQLLGGGGNDQIFGAAGDDTLNGGARNDTLTGASENDILDGGNGGDELMGDGGNDTLDGQDGSDTLFGGSESDILDGGNGDDELNGEGGEDTLDGQNGNDILTGGTENDLLAGGNGDDDLSGDDGDDSLEGGAGNDTLFGGLGVDTAVFSGNFADYFFVDLNDGIFNVIDLFPDDGDDGVDQLSQIEFAEFAGGFVTPVPPAGIGNIQLSDVAAGTGGFVINGTDIDERTGLQSIGANDVDGDGFSDMILGTVVVPGAGDMGEANIVFGKTDTALVDLSDVSGGGAGFTINGIDITAGSGPPAGNAGDVNGDGFADVIVGSFAATVGGAAEAGESYVVFGGPGPVPVELSDIASDANNQGFVIRGIGAGDRSGISVLSAGDVNGDGLSDVIVGGFRADPKGTDEGQSYVVFGKMDGIGIDLDADIVNGAFGFAIDGIDDFDYSGIDVGSAGDINGDGLDDLIIGATGADPLGQGTAGEAYVVFGKTDSGKIALSDVALGTGGIVLSGIAAGDRLGGSVSAAGDVNGDGFDDIIVGARYADVPSGMDGGQSYVVFGSANPVSLLAADVVNGTGGFAINGVGAGDQSGLAVGGADDVNGDGFDDLVIGARFANPNGIMDAGQGYIVFGDAAPQTVELSDIAAGTSTSGFAINGIDPDDLSGFALGGAGDVNGDGFSDVVIGALQANPNGLDNAGSSFVVFGANFSGDVTGRGTSGDDNLGNGLLVDDEILVGGLGDDTFMGGINAVIRGGAGDDEIGISSINFADIEGGSGNDIVTYNESLNLNLTTIPNSRIAGIEEFDIEDESGNLTLDAQEVLNISDTSNQLIVRSNLGGGNVNGGGGWVRIGEELIDGTQFTRFVQGQAALVVQSDINQSNTQFSIQASIVKMGLGGFVINGRDNFDRSGYSVSEAGDVNGDGLADVIVGAFGADPNATSRAGESYVVFGKLDNTAVDLENVAAGTGGFLINGIGGDLGDGDASGVSVSGAGDVNGDGFDDVIVGAPDGDGPGDSTSLAGESYVVFGSNAPGTVELSDITAGSGGFIINGNDANDFSGRMVGDAGDVNGDGLDDLIIGARQADANTGETYVVFGKNGDSNPVNLSSVELGIGGFVIAGISPGDFAGNSVHGAGDVNGDGLDDVVIGAYGVDVMGEVDVGEAYVVFGKGDGTAVSLLDVQAGTGGFVLFGSGDLPGDGDLTGFRVGGHGDVNGDGLSDVIVSARNADPGGMVGDEQTGHSVSIAGDVNGDGLDDLIVGSIRADINGADAGKSYLVYGKADFDAVELSDIEAGNGGFVIFGAGTSDNSGRSVSGAGDINGDGFDDLIVGADQQMLGSAGESYIIYGGNFSGADFLGDDSDDNFVGSDANEVFVGGRGDDTLAGGGGMDVVRGGAGDDQISVADATFSRISGGIGSDHLQLAGVFDLNLSTTVPRTAISEIEEIILSDAGASILSLDVHNVVALTDGPNLKPDDAQFQTVNTLVVTGDGDDTLDIDLVGFSDTGLDTTVDDQGSYSVFDHATSNARIVVDDDLILT